jgi:hypothetical protein
MTTKGLFKISSILILLIGLSWILMPRTMLSMWGLEANDALIYLAQRFAAAVLGFAVLLWLAGTAYKSDPERAIIGGVFFVSTLMLIFSLYGVLSSLISAWGWGAVIGEALLSLGFGCFLFLKRGPAA